MVSLANTSLLTSVSDNEVLNLVDRQIKNNGTKLLVPREVFMPLFVFPGEGTAIEPKCSFFFQTKAWYSNGSHLFLVLARL